MPLYDYECQLCGPFTLSRSMSARNDPAHCEECGLEAGRVIHAPNLALMNPLSRKASIINERSQHQPRVTNRHSCSSRCGCGGAGKPEKKRNRFQAGKPNSRPWMLGH